jgi:hypothetical protein
MAVVGGVPDRVRVVPCHFIPKREGRTSVHHRTPERIAVRLTFPPHHAKPLPAFDRISVLLCLRIVIDRH